MTRSDTVTGSAPTRAELVGQAVDQWIDAVSTLGGRDPLLSYRDLKVGTLDLAAAEPDARKRLLEGEQVLISKLFPYEPLRTSALRSVRAIRDKTRELAEERGLQVCYLAVGIATWANPFAARRPTAPVMLRSATVVARDPAETDFVITIADDPFVNPVLLHALDKQLGLRFQPNDLRDPAGQLRYATVVERLREFAPPHVIDGFSIAHRAVLATFTTVPLTLARDLTAFGVDLWEHDAVAALAGDVRALSALAFPGTPVTPCHRVLETNAEQDAVVEAVAEDGHLRVDAPPGTGRTQAAAALAAELVGRGQRVLVVSQKRAMLDDFVGRLRRAGLDDIVLDAGRRSPSEAVRQITATARRLAGSHRTSVDVSTGGKATVLAARLDAYRDALHQVREQWGVSAYDAMVLVATSDESARTAARINPDVLAAAGSPAEVRAKLREYADLEGLTLNQGATPWFGANVAVPQLADELMDTVTDLRERSLPNLRDSATRAAVEVGLAGPTTVGECLAAVDLLAAVSETAHAFGPQIWDEPLDDFAAATGDRAFRAEHPGGLGYLTRRRLRRRLAELTGLPGRHYRQRLHQSLLAANEQLEAWREHTRDGRPPRTGPHLPAAIEAAETVRRDLAALAAANPRTEDLASLSFGDVANRLDELIADEDRLRALPRIYVLQAELSAAGLDELVADLRRRSIAPAQVDAVFDYAWYSSLLDRWCADDPALRGFDREAHEQLVDEFNAADLVERQAAAGRVLDARTASFAVAAGEHEGQAAVLTESKDDSLPATPKDLVGQAPDVALAAVPCWVVSPLAVVDVLPARRLFDVVIIEDASRLAVAEAVPAIARAARLVLMGDGEVARSPFSTAVEPAPDPDEHEGPWAQEPPASVVDLLRDVLPQRSLTGQYRVHDDRLIGFAARTVHAGRLTTVPAANGDERLTMEVVEAPASADDPVDSSSAEVERVVELVLDHVRTRPHESLGVVTLGPRHAERLDAALRSALIRAPAVAAQLSDDREEPFFIKDVEQVGGDVRDAVILSLGYGRSVDGRILYRFGALGRPGGERRLVAASTCARQRLTVVATFGANDLSQRRLTTSGAQALGSFLAYVQHGADSAQDANGGEVQGEPLAQLIAERLQEAGVTAPIVVGHGGPEGVAVAVRHPTRRDRFVLAVETDGPAYAARETARERERLRPAQLTKLGWSVHRVWSPAWATDPDSEVQRLLAAYERAVADADAYDWAVAAAESDVVAGGAPASRTPAARVPASRVSSKDEKAASAESADATTTATVIPPVEGTPSKGNGGATKGEGVATRAGGAAKKGQGAAKKGQGAAKKGEGVAKKAADAAPSDGGGEADEPAEPPQRDSARPPVLGGQAITEYTCRQLAAMARWVESDGLTRDEDDVAALVAEDLGLNADEPRTRDVLRHAVRVTRAGWPLSS